MTSYDIRLSPYANVGQVLNANECYWFCRGDFWSTPRVPEPLVYGIPTSGAAACLVVPNNRNESGTVLVYAIDGVCHQVANQVLYVTANIPVGRPLTVSKARGYTLSSLLYGTYGRREQEWDQARINCGVKPINAWRRRGLTSLLSRRMAYCLNTSTNDPNVMDLERRRRALLLEIDTIGFRQQLPNETVQQRVAELNFAINNFLREAEEFLPDDNHLLRVLGIERSQEAFVIDPELFQFQNPEDRPLRNAILGW